MTASDVGRPPLNPQNKVRQIKYFCLLVQVYYRMVNGKEHGAQSFDWRIPGARSWWEEQSFLFKPVNITLDYVEELLPKR